MYSKTLHQFCAWHDEKGALDVLEFFGDIDILYNDGAIIRTMIANNQVSALKAALDYFENKQFPVKDSKYEEASDKLIEILEDATDGTGVPLEITTLISEYIGNDIALLRDIDGTDESQPSEHDATTHGIISSTISKSSRIEDCIVAAKTGDRSIILQNLDIKNHSQKFMVISTAIQNQQEGIIDTVIDMAQNSKQKATVVRTAGDIYAQSCLFEKAEEYYNKSFEMHPNYYITYSKIGALYQRWSYEESLDSHQKMLLQDKAIESYNMALERKPKHIIYAEVEERLEIVSKQLECLKSNHSVSNNADIESYEATEELLSYLSDGDEIDKEKIDKFELRVAHKLHKSHSEPNLMQNQGATRFWHSSSESLLSTLDSSGSDDTDEAGNLGKESGLFTDLGNQETL